MMDVTVPSGLCDITQVMVKTGSPSEVIVRVYVESESPHIRS